jgi:glycosyltransferase involved in cell wall biosynthesis
VNSPVYGWSARHAELVVTSSEAAGRDVVSEYGVNPARLRVVHLAASEEFRVVGQDARVEEARARYLDAGRPFFLYVGKLTGRRNIPTLIRAFAEFKRQTGDAHGLVLIGLNTTGVPVGRLAEELGIVGDVRHYDHIDDTDLNLLYNAAESFVLPYTYEAAFSLTALEAQVTGTPLITVDAPGLHESTGSAALFIPAPGVSEISGAMARLARDEALRRELAERGLENAKRFSWERASHETLAVLAEAARR